MHRIAPLAALVLAPLAHAQEVFTDDFASGPSPLWSNTRGDWAAANGEYFALAPSNSPPTITTLPFELGDLDLDVDVRAVIDGGVWLHIDEQGNNGVLLVTGGNGHSGTGLYFHTVHNGGFSGQLGATAQLFNQNDDIHLTIRVRGPVYSIYLNGSTDPVAQLETPDFPAGRVGLYDYTADSQRFDNVVLVDAGCVADFNHSGGTPDDADVSAFFAAWNNGDDSADVNRSGGTPDDADVSYFFARWNEGC